jgi:competence protein ComEA
LQYFFIAAWLLFLTMQFVQKKWIKEYFTFSQKEKRAVVLLLILAVVFALLPSVFPFLVKPDDGEIVDAQTQNQLSSLVATAEKNNQEDEDEPDHLYQPKQFYQKKYGQVQSKGELFYFNPNTASEEEFVRLGVRDKTIATILNYRNKGGKFFKPEDLERIYNLRHEEYERLLPYVRIEAAPSEHSTTAATFSTAQPKQYERKEFTAVTVDINTADTAQWKMLRGIGSGYAKRIVNFRNKLGGFVSVEQVAETFGLPDSVFQKIKPQLKLNISSVNKINLNTATVDELKAHPYIKYGIANAIVQYRNEHGMFKAVSDLQKLTVVDNNLYQKVEGYLTVE